MAEKVYEANATTLHKKHKKHIELYETQHIHKKHKTHKKWTGYPKQNHRKPANLQTSKKDQKHKTHEKRTCAHMQHRNYVFSPSHFIWQPRLSSMSKMRLKPQQPTHEYY